MINFRQRFEAGRSFDLDDDLEFCPNLLTEVDMVSIHSSTSDRSSLSSGSPEQSPQSVQAQPDPAFSLNSNSNPYIPSYQSQPTPLKLHQPSANRGPKCHSYRQSHDRNKHVQHEPTSIGFARQSDALNWSSMVDRICIIPHRCRVCLPFSQ